MKGREKPGKKIMSFLLYHFESGLLGLLKDAFYSSNIESLLDCWPTYWELVNPAQYFIALMERVHVSCST